MKSIFAAVAVLFFTLNSPFPVAAQENGWKGACVSQCVQDLGGQASPLCVLACEDDLQWGQCGYGTDGCCNQLLAGFDPDCTDSGTTLLEERVASLEAVVAQQQAAMALLLEKLAYLRVEYGELYGLKGPHVIIEGANLHLRSGSGKTREVRGTLPSGLGNLIVGYNEPPAKLQPGERRGSHNIVSGIGHRYSSLAGLVAGEDNSIRGEFSAVIGGWENTVASWGGVAIGGVGNLVNGTGVAVGGSHNVADHGSIFGSSNSFAHLGGTVVGGNDNEAQGDRATVLGGNTNSAAGSFSTVSGGFGNSAFGDYSTVSGGANHSVLDFYDWAAGSLLEDE